VNVTLHLGDCLDVMRGIEAGSVDYIITDPPYGQSNEAYDRGVAPDVWRECYRVAKPDAALVSFAGSPTYHRIASDIEAAGWRVRQMWAWVYRDGFMTSAYPREGFDRLAPAMDPICFATRGKMLLNLQREGESAWRKDRNAFGSPSYSERTSSHGKTHAVGHWPRSIAAESGLDDFRYFVLSRGMGGFGWAGEKTGHPNQKPLALMKWIVSKFRPPGTILDPFAGSGTTLIAALAEGFDAIGIERHEPYFRIAERRIAREAEQAKLFV
jgi:DNA modification methylase